MRTIQRVIRRAGFPIEYSKGFNPHMAISIAQPLAVGMYSCGDYMDIQLTEALQEDYIKEAFNQNAPEGVRAIEVKRIENKENEKKIPQAMALIDAANYDITIKYIDAAKLASELDSLQQNKNWNIIKKSKSGEKEINILDYLIDFKYSIEDNKLIIKTVTACGSRENLSAELLAKFIVNNTTGADGDAFIDIMRSEMFTKYEGRLIALKDYV